MAANLKVTCISSFILLTYMIMNEVFGFFQHIILEEHYCTEDLLVILINVRTAFPQGTGPRIELGNYFAAAR